MTDSIDYKIDFGTPERARRGNMKMEPRDVANGGRIITTGLTEKDTSVLDYLRNHAGHLGSPAQTERRYGAGMKLWGLFSQFGDTQPTKDIGTPGRGSPGQDPISEGDVGDWADVAESIYHDVMEQLNYSSHIVRYICIEGHLNWPCTVNVHPRYLDQLHIALDLLESVLERTEAEYRKDALTKTDF